MFSKKNCFKNPFSLQIIFLYFIIIVFLILLVVPSSSVASPKDYSDQERLLSFWFGLSSSETPVIKKSVSENQSTVSQNQNKVTFNRNLKLGDRGRDVLRLQEILNQDHQTRVASSGPGSPGNETEFFGSLTHSAVVRFQEKYRSEVLVPANLNRGTGFFGPLTRNKINQTEKTQTVSGSLMNPNLIKPPKRDNFSSLDIDLGSSDDFMLAFPSKYFGPHFTSLEIIGSGFSNRVGNLKVLFGNDYSIDSVNVINDGKISVRIPSSIPRGEYQVRVSDGREIAFGESFFIITRPSDQPPKIDSISPSSGKYGKTVVVRGSNFTTDNTIMTTYNEIKGVVSDNGQTLEFKMTPLSNNPEVEALVLTGKSNLENTTDVYIYIKNEKGISAEPIIFELEI